MRSTSNRPAGASDTTVGRTGRALVVRIGALGDVLLTRRLTYSLSLAGFRSTLLAPARNTSLLLADPWIEEVIDSEGPACAGAFAGAWPEESRGFEVALLISRSTGLAKAIRCAAATVIQIPPEPARDHAPLAQQWADAASSVCAPFTAGLPLLGTNAAAALVSGATLIHPGSGSERKNWPLERFADLGLRLNALGHHVTWIRGPADAACSNDIPSGQVIDRPSLQALAATLGQSRLFVGNDSGVSHLAAAVGAPSVVLFGPTDAAVWRPDGPRVRTVRSATGEMADIPVEAVVAGADDVTRLRLPGRL